MAGVALKKARAGGPAHAWRVVNAVLVAAAPRRVVWAASPSAGSADRCAAGQIPATLTGTQRERVTPAIAIFIACASGIRNRSTCSLKSRPVSLISSLPLR